MGATSEFQGGTTWRDRRRDMQMIFQNPFGALNPRLPIGRQMREVLDTHKLGAPEARDDTCHQRSFRSVPAKRRDLSGTKSGSFVGLAPSQRVSMSTFSEFHHVTHCGAVVALPHGLGNWGRPRSPHSNATLSTKLKNASSVCIFRSDGEKTTSSLDVDPPDKAICATSSPRPVLVFQTKPVPIPFATAS